jgi:flagellar hook-length control protein FliK
MSAQSVMSVILPAASTAAGAGMSEDTTTDGALFATLVADLSEATGTTGISSAPIEASSPMSLDAVVSETEASLADAVAAAWPPIPVIAPLIPQMEPDAPAPGETLTAKVSQDLLAAPSPDIAAPMIDVEAPSPVLASGSQELIASPQTGLQADAPERPASNQEPPAAPTDARASAAPVQATQTPPPVSPTGLVAALAVSRATVVIPNIDTAAADTTDTASVEAPGSSTAAAPQASTNTSVSTPPVPTAPQPLLRSRDPQGRGEDRPSNAAVIAGNDAQTSTVSSTSEATTPRGSALTTGLASSPARGDETTAAPAAHAAPGEVSAPIDGDGTAPAAPPLESQAGAPAANRDLGLSMLSRATIETTAQIAAQIIRKLDGRSTRFDMVLTPEGLGNVDVTMDIDSDGRLTARLAFDNPAAATDLRGRADDLRRQLQEAGFQLSQDSLEFAERNPSSGFGGGGFDRAPDRRAFTGAARLAAEADLAAPPPGAWASLSLTPDRVDLKV